MATSSTADFQVTGKNKEALFTLKVYRGEGMLLLAMNWRNGTPPKDFVGFSIEYREPNGDRYYALKNRISFQDGDKKISEKSISSMLAPFQKFRWVHFPRNADLQGKFRYVVKPVFMNYFDELSYGDAQTVDIVLGRDTHPEKLNVSFTRGFISSQAFVDRYEADGGVAALLPAKAEDGLDFQPTHPKTKEALAWMGFEATDEILKILDAAIKDKKAQVRVVAYDLNLPQVVDKLVKLGNRLKIIIDDSAGHDKETSPESRAAQRLEESTPGNVKRHHMNQLQHNKTIVVDGPTIKAAVCGSTNFTWRGFYVQSNNAVIIRGEEAIRPFTEAFDNYWAYDKMKDFGKTSSALWNDLKMEDIDVVASFSPHAAANALLDEIGADLKSNTKSSLFYSLAFLYQTQGAIREAVEQLTGNKKLFVYGVSDKKVAGLDLQKPDGNVMPVYSAELSQNLPEPFKSEPKGGGGVRMHHKFIVSDFNKPTARVYLGSYNFSTTADKKNGENLLLIRNRKIATAYMIEALRIFDHYHFRVAMKEAKQESKPLFLAKPPRKAGEKPWWEEYYTNDRKIRDRELFA